VKSHVEEQQINILWMVSITCKCDKMQQTGYLMIIILNGMLSNILDLSSIFDVIMNTIISNAKW